MTAFRRLTANFALERAVELARETGRPLLDIRTAARGLPVRQRPVAPVRAGWHGGTFARPRGHPCHVLSLRRAFTSRRARTAAGPGLDVRPQWSQTTIRVSSCRAWSRAQRGRWMRAWNAWTAMGCCRSAKRRAPFATALSFRAHMQRSLLLQVETWPSPLNLRDLPVPAARVSFRASTRARWPPASADDLDESGPRAAAACRSITASAPVPLKGGATAALRPSAALRRQRSSSLYADGHSHPDDDATSRLSPWLHFGHISAHEVFEAVMTRERWTSRSIGRAAGGKRAGLVGRLRGQRTHFSISSSPGASSASTCAPRVPPTTGPFASLPALGAGHARDPQHATRARPLYCANELERRRTHDAVWNAAQRQLVRDGWMHNYLRMLWGKKILEWTASPRRSARRR